MAITKCKECKKEVSTSAKVCPHCGVKEPGVTAKQKASGCLVLIVLVVLATWWLSSNDDAKPADTTKAACSNTDTQCNFDRNLVDASTKCKPLVEKSAKFDYEWTDGTLEPIFSHARLDSKNNQLTFIGDKVKFANGFNAKSTMTYACVMDLKTKEIVDFRISEGKL